MQGRLTSGMQAAVPPHAQLRGQPRETAHAEGTLGCTRRVSLPCRGLLTAAATQLLLCGRAHNRQAGGTCRLRGHPCAP